jgi:Zn-dependent oligopeptidase
LLEYRNHAEYQLEVRMAKTPDAVFKFLTELKDKLMPQGQAELLRLLQLKKQEKQELKLPFDGKINSWDTSYYNNILLQKEYQVDREEVKQYFPLEHVTSSMLELYQKLLSLRFEEITSSSLANFWHPDVRSFIVKDATSNNLIGQFYLDLFPR